MDRWIACRAGEWSIANALPLREDAGKREIHRAVGARACHASDHLARALELPWSRRHALSIGKRHSVNSTSIFRAGLKSASRVDAILNGVEAGKADHWKLDSEGGAQATSQKSRYLKTAIIMALWPLSKKVSPRSHERSNPRPAPSRRHA
ncbi:MAG TPA: hypothetical protein VNE63_00455 [Candidatus Acidoferrales bacterium]|nr:hypothetical protein [Candidatus Acidoferrales bacterium]